MSARVFSPVRTFGLSPVAAATFLSILLPDVAAAARCPLGEIYRPSRGVCVSKERAIAAGVYRGHARASAVTAARVAENEAPAATAPAPKPRPQEPRPVALAEIERQAPVVATTRLAQDEPALAFAAQPVRVAAKPVAPVVMRASAPIEVRPAARTVPRLRDATPFGSLVALEPMP